MRNQCLISFTIGSYNDKVMSDMLDMSAYHILLGRPWKHDRHSVYDGFSNIYTIKHEGKLKDLLPLPLCKAIPTLVKKKKVNFIISKKECNREVQAEGICLVLFVKEISENKEHHHPRVLLLLEEYSDVFPSDLPEGLTPFRGI